MITPLSEVQGEPRYPLDPVSIDVTMAEHIELLKSPKKCLRLGIDITYERMIYEHRRQYNGFPPLPDIDPNEEIDIGLEN